MYVIEVSGTGAIAAISRSSNSDPQYIPADRCIWEQSYTDGQYTITNVAFLTGNANAVDIDSAAADFRLGYIGKSGRFVAITS